MEDDALLILCPNSAKDMGGGRKGGQKIICKIVLLKDPKKNISFIRE